MAASYGRRRSNTSPSTSQAPGPRETTMPLESGGDPGGPHPPMGKGDSPDGGQSRRISQAPGVQVKTEGEGR